MISVPVELGDRRYEVLIGPDARRELARVVAERAPSAARVAMVADEALTGLAWFADLDPGLPFDLHCLPGGEAHKSLATVEDLCRRFARSRLARSDLVVAVGGGVVTDTAGFAAAAYHRGTAYLNVATTLLAQVDAAIGGKTGVDLPEGKNLVGAFWQPRAVLCDTTTLGTLPEREWACGRGELAKYVFLDPDGLGGPSLLELPIDQQVARCAAIKAAIVAADEREGDRRVLLNYGHTLAHALEATALAAGDDLRHGEAVGIGLVFAARLARRLGRVDDGRVDLHDEVVDGLGLPTGLPPGSDPRELLGYMARDKKAHHDLTFVLDGPDGPGVVRGVGEDDVLATLAEMVPCG